MNDNRDFLEKDLDELIESIKRQREKTDLVWQQYAKEKRDIVARYGELINLSKEESKEKLNEIVEELNDQYMRLMSTDLDFPVKLKYEEELFKDLEEAVKLYEDYGSLSNEEKISILDQKYEEIEQKIKDEQNRIKNEIMRDIRIKVGYLDNLLRIGYDKDRIIEAYLKLENFEFGDKELDFSKKVTIDTELNKFPQLNSLIEEFRKKQIDKNKYEKIYQKIDFLMDEFYKSKDYTLLSEVSKLTEILPESQKKINVVELIKEESKKLIIEKLNLEIDDALKTKDLEKIDSIVKRIRDLGLTFDENDPLIKRIKEIREKLTNITPSDIDNDKNKPKKKGKKTSLTWKTALATAIGAGIGSAVFFTAGAVGVSIVVVAGGIANKIISNKRTKILKLNGPIKIQSISEPTPGLKGKFEKFKNYLKSEEGLRDITWMINSAMITTGILQVASLINNAVSSTINSGPEVTPEPEPQTLDTQTPTDVPTQTDIGDMKIGDSLGENVPDVGYDSVSLANNGMNQEQLISEYVNSDSIIKGVGIQNADGTITRITTNGMSLNDIASKFGVSKDDLVLDVASKDGVSLAWTKLADMVKNVGGKIR